MPARKDKAEEILTVARPHGLEAVYERDADGTVTRTVRPAAKESAKPAATED